MAITGFREASRLIFVDELTGLYNRRFMRQYLRERLVQVAQVGAPLAVIMLDLDGFKQVNDSYGHLDGDQVLKTLAQLIRDALPPNSYAIRFAGDEFFVFLEGVDGSGGVRVAEEIRERVSREGFLTDKAAAGISVRVSLGVAAYPEDAPSPAELIDAADQALYRSKRAGKDRVSRAGSWRLPPEVEVLKRFPCPRLVGREAELAQLERPLTEGRHNRLVLVEASRGLGKTRLLLEQMRRARSTGHHCFFARCLESDRAIPYSTLGSVLADCFSREPDRWEMVQGRLEAAPLAELSALLSRPASSAGASQTRSAEERRSLRFHAVSDVLTLLSADVPLLLFLDDLQFVDEASLEVLIRLLERADGRVIVYSAVQSEALQRLEGTRLAHLLGTLRQARHFQRVGLAALTADQAGRMVTEILERHTPSPSFFQRLYETSRGIPLFVEETLKGLINSNALRAVEGVWDLDAVEPSAVPATLEGVIKDRLDALDQELHQMIAKAAVVGPHLDLELLAGILGKDPGETLHLVDKGKKHRVFEEPGVMTDEEEVRFLSQCFQQIVYEGIDPADRRRTHRTVGEVAERLAGEQLEQMLGPLAYHFERSDDPVKGELYRRRAQEHAADLFSAAEIAREFSLKVDAEDEGRALSPEEWPLGERVVRTQAVVVKNMRVYPAGSRLVQDGVSALSAAILELMKSVESFTLSEEGSVLHVNGQPVEHKGLLPIAQDLLRVFADHDIRRCTFERGIAHADILGLLKILSGPSQGTRQDVTGWDRRLASDGIRHVRIFPVIYLAASAGTAAWRREHSDALLDDPTLPLVRDVLRSLATVVDNIRLYPPESQLITLTFDQLERHAQSMFARIPTLTVALAEGSIVVNAARANPRQFGITIELLQKLMDDSGLTSLTIRRGVTREQLRTFLTHLAEASEAAAERDPAFWQHLLEQSQITGIEVGTRAYAVAARLAADETPGAEAPEAGRPPEPGLSAEQQALELASRWLEEPLSTFLGSGVQEHLPVLLVALGQMGREDLAVQLLERAASGLAEGDGILRAGAAAGLGLALERGDEASSAWVLGKCLGPLIEAVAREGHREALRTETELATLVLRRLLRTGEVQSAGRLTAALGTMIAHAPDPARFTEAVRGVVDALVSTESFEPVFAAFKTADAGRRSQARAVLAGFGVAGRAYLSRLVYDSPDIDIARAAAEVLAAQGPAGVRVVTHGLEQEPAIARLTRATSVLDVLAPTLGADYLFLVGHPETEVRTELARALTRAPRQHALRFVSLALSDRRPQVLLGALECARALEAVELLDTVIHIIDNPPSQSLLRAACLSLGRLRDARAAAALSVIAARRPRFFGLVRGLPEPVRAAAVRALGELGIPEAKAGLERALKDPANPVRSAARLSLLKLELEARSPAVPASAQTRS